MLLHKMLRDIKKYKIQFLSIFLLNFLGVFIYSGIYAEWYGFQKERNQYYKESNFADIWIYGKDFTIKDLNKVAEINHITGVERRVILEGKAGNDSSLTLNYIEDNRISAFKVTDGDSFNPEKNGIWLDREYAKANGLKTGDTFKFSIAGNTISQTILGLIIHPEYIYNASGTEVIPDHKKNGYGFLSSKTLPVNLPVCYNLLVITTDQYRHMENSIRKVLGDKISIFLLKDNLPSNKMLMDEIAKHRAMGTVFPIAFLAIAVLTIMTTMTRMINSQRIQIGTLKALGFQRNQILFHYLSYGLSISTLGALTGTILAPVILPQPFYRMNQTYYVMPEWKAAVSPVIILMAVFAVTLSTLAVFITCRNILLEIPAEALRPKPPKEMKHSRIEEGKLWKKMSFQLQWNLRDILRNKLRSLTTILGVVGCTMLLFCGLTLKDSFAGNIKWIYHDIFLYNTKIKISEQAGQEKINQISKEYDAELIMEGMVELEANGIKRTGGSLVTDQVTLLNYKNVKKKDNITDGISISRGMAKALKVSVGDRIQWHEYNNTKWETAIISGIYQTPMNQGIILSKKVYENSGYTFRPNAALTKDTAVKEMEGITDVITKGELIDSFGDTMMILNVMVGVLIGAAVLLAFIVLYNLGILSFTERYRELATLKVIGFKTKRIRKLLFMQNIWLSGLGILFGIPFGNLLFVFLKKSLPDSFDLKSCITIPSIIFCILGVLLLSQIVDHFFSHRVKSIDMVSSLKGVE